MIVAKNSKSVNSLKNGPICRSCFHQVACEFELDSDGRCLFYIKEELVGTENRARIDSMDRFTIDYEVIERMI